MFHHSETHLSCFPTDRNEKRERRLSLYAAPHQKRVIELARERGYKKSDQPCRINVLPFAGEPFAAAPPEGFSIADGCTVPPFYSANAHMFAFDYTLPTADRIKEGFEQLKQMKGYDPELDLVALDPEGKPVGLAMGWYAPGMPYCELEPLGVAWWCRRMGIGRALIAELSNRFMRKYPGCGGMVGGDQPFYYGLGFETVAENEVWRWCRGQ